jgi:hypothetical protein
VNQQIRHAGLNRSAFILILILILILGFSSLEFVGPFRTLVRPVRYGMVILRFGSSIGFVGRRRLRGLAVVGLRRLRGRRGWWRVRLLGPRVVGSWVLRPWMMGSRGSCGMMCSGPGRLRGVGSSWAVRLCIGGFRGRPRSLRTSAGGTWN